MEKKYNGSETGGHAAWKGFFSQTLYIANLLLTIQKECNLFPENVEDLKIEYFNNTIELVQVKNYNQTITLSNIEPKNKEDTFFKRALHYKKTNNNQTVKLKLVSFGDVSKELQDFSNNTNPNSNKVKEKLVAKKFSKSDIKWLQENLIIEIVNQQNLNNSINNFLSNKIQTGIAPDLFEDLLIQYIAKLSKNGGYTNKEIWDRKVNNIADQLSQVDAFYKQFGQTIVPLSSYEQSDTPREILKEEYYSGVNASPRHIKGNLDFVRINWLERIDDSFQNSNLTIVKGISGQGKSSLCYRYLYNYFPHNNIYIIEDAEGVSSEISAALERMSHTQDEIIVYYDVSPRDNEWVNLCEKLYKRGTNIKVLVSIREEDYNRSSVDLSKTPFNIINLDFSESEAIYFYERYKDVSEFRSFEEAWSKFGGSGPLMEFTYLLIQSETLEEKLEKQVKRMGREQDDSDNWLGSLLIINYAGQYGIEINLEKLFQTIKVKNKFLMIEYMKNEYLIRTSKNDNSVNSVHIVRAKILSGILINYMFTNEFDYIRNIINSTKDDVSLMLIDYFYENPMSEVNFLNLIKQDYDSWRTYSSVIRASIWLDVRKYFLLNENVLLTLNKICNNNFPAFFVGDITGEFENYNPIDDWLANNLMTLQQYNKIKSELSSFSTEHIEYKFTDLFFETTFNNIPLSEKINPSDYSYIGYGLFWLAKRGFKINDIKIDSSNIDIRDLNKTLDLLVGIQSQALNEVYDLLYENIRNIIVEKHNILFMDDSQNKFEVLTLYSLIENDVTIDSNLIYSSVMEAIYDLRRLDINKSSYSVKIIGSPVEFDEEDNAIPDHQKKIPIDNLPFEWLTELNRWFIHYFEYNFFENSWADVVDNVNYSLQFHSSIFSEISNVLNKTYKKKKSQNRLLIGTYSKISKEFISKNNTALFSSKLQTNKLGLKNYSINNVDSEIINSFNSKKEDNDIPTLKYFIKFNNTLASFYEQFSIVLADKPDKPSNIRELCFYNLSDSISNLIKASNSFSEDFAKENNLLSKTEIEELKNFVAGVYYFLFSGIKPINQFKRFIQQKNRKVDKKLEIFMKWLKETYNFKSINKELVASMQLTEIDDFFIQIDNKFRSLFPELEPFAKNYDSFFISNFFPDLLINLYIGNKPINLECILKKSYLVESKDVEQLMVRSLNINWSITEDEISNSILDLYLLPQRMIGITKSLENYETNIHEFYNDNMEPTLGYYNLENDYLKVFAKLMEQTQLNINIINRHIRLGNNLTDKTSKSIEEIEEYFKNFPFDSLKDDIIVEQMNGFTPLYTNYLEEITQYLNLNN